MFYEIANRSLDMVAGGNRLRLRVHYWPDEAAFDAGDPPEAEDFIYIHRRAFRRTTIEVPVMTGRNFAIVGGGTISPEALADAEMAHMIGLGPTPPEIVTTTEPWDAGEYVDEILQWHYGQNIAPDNGYTPTPNPDYERQRTATDPDRVLDRQDVQELKGRTSSRLEVARGS